MGKSHAPAHHKHPGFEIVGLFNRWVVTNPKDYIAFASLKGSYSIARLNTVADAGDGNGLRNIAGGGEIDEIGPRQCCDWSDRT